MLYLHDVWVNWFEGEENGYNVCEFHEWRKTDSIELLDQVPILKIDRCLFNYIENDLAEIPQALLDDIYQKAYARKNHQRIQLEYCFLITDGIGILAVDTMGYRLPIRKSRIIPRQAQLVYDMTENADPVDYYDFQEEGLREYHILSPAPDTMAGLTRKERQLKQLLFMALDQLYSAENIAEVRYWYTEWKPEKYAESQTMNAEDMWNELYNDVQKGWSAKHDAYCRSIIKGQPFFEKLWQFEQEERVN
ncbi:hypothetical protein CIB95_01385 [Lottiidibacillus patelloidae]|uniref:Uncharacterized protein n=1 Tax=Lottiidibacillus patelloidae TaxID=2670334 RepID=A0A263BXF6_9BACI|nr:YjbA family protein [Lottiidibacillus patelloidae]OZM58252.1 hypothetical protein CIB95_01385 [Lottiidibacillus patelloidae]